LSIAGDICHWTFDHCHYLSQLQEDRIISKIDDERQVDLEAGCAGLPTTDRLDTATNQQELLWPKQPG